MPSADQNQASAESLTVYGLPRSHYHCSLANFAWDAVKPLKLRAHVEAFLAGAVGGQWPHLVLLGEPGIGKTHIGVAVYRYAVAHVGTGLAQWLNVPKFCEEVKRAYGNDNKVDPFEEYDEARRLVVMDDLFGRELTRHEESQIVSRLVDTAYQNNAAMVITMNKDVRELSARMVSHEVSRMLAGATVVKMSADKDWRIS